MAVTGYDYDSVESVPKHLLCCICELPCRDVRHIGCRHGHVCCRSCLKLHLKDNSIATITLDMLVVHVSFPKCSKKVSRNMPITSPIMIMIMIRNRIRMIDAWGYNLSYFESDDTLDNQIMLLRIRCSWNGNCNWVGAIADIVLEYHIWQPLPPDFNRYCMTFCNLCENLVVHDDTLQNSDNSCCCFCRQCYDTTDKEKCATNHRKHCYIYLLPIACPNRCGKHIHVGEIDDHRTKCPSESIECTYQCGIPITRRYEKIHYTENLVKHIEITHKMLHQISTKTQWFVDQSLKTTIEFQRDNIQSCKSAITINNKLGPLLVLIILFVAAFMVGLIRNQSSKVSEVHVLWPLLFHSSSEKTLNSNEVTPVILRFANFSEKVKNSALWHSRSFFAFNKGYQVWVKSNASSIIYSDKYIIINISATLYLMESSHDDKLEDDSYFPVKGVFSIELLNQLNNDSHHTCLITAKGCHRYECDNSVEEYKEGIGKCDFQNIIHTTYASYMKDDTFFLRVSYAQRYNHDLWELFKPGALAVVLFYIIPKVIVKCPNKIVAAIYVDFVILLGNYVTGSLTGSMLWIMMILVIDWICETITNLQQDGAIVVYMFFGGIIAKVLTMNLLPISELSSALMYILYTVYRVVCMNNTQFDLICSYNERQEFICFVG